jgi:hypothetical protein
MMGIVLHMILGPRQERYVRYCLDNVAEHVDLAVVNDNGNNPENLREVQASRFFQEGRMVYFQSEFQGFAHARNQCIQRTPDGDWQWLFRLDADECYYPDRMADLTQDLATWHAEGIAAVRIPFWHLLSFRVWQSYEEATHFFRWSPSLRWEREVHEVLRIGGTTKTATDCPIVHYSYTTPPEEVFAKWKQYSDLEGDFHHYDGRDPATIIDDRYAYSGAPFFEEHPPPIDAIIQRAGAAGQFHDVPLPVLIAIHVTEVEAAMATWQNIQQTWSPDYPVVPRFFAPPTLLNPARDRFGIEQVREIPEMEPVHFRRLALQHATILEANGMETLHQDIGHLLMVEGGTQFVSGQGWLKALVNAVYCKPGYEAYCPNGAQTTLLVPRDVWDQEPNRFRVYNSPFCTVREEI